MTVWFLAHRSGQPRACIAPVHVHAKARPPWGGPARVTAPALSVSCSIPVPVAAHLIHDVQRAGWRSAQMMARVDAPDKAANALMRQHFARYFADPPKPIGKAKGGKKGKARRGKRRKAQ